MHVKDLRTGEDLIRRVAQLKHDFALPQARALQCFLESSRLDEVLGMVSEVNTTRAFERNVGEIVHIQRMIHGVEFFLVGVYSVEWFHALAQGFGLHGVLVGWGSYFTAAIPPMFLYWLLERKRSPHAGHVPAEEQQRRGLWTFLIVQTVLFSLIAFIMTCCSLNLESAASKETHRNANTLPPAAPAAAPVASPEAARPSNRGPEPGGVERKPAAPQEPQKVLPPELKPHAKSSGGPEGPKR